MVKALIVAVATSLCGSLSAQSPAPGTPIPYTPTEACVKELHTPVRHVCGVIFTRKGQVQDGVLPQVHYATVTLMRDGTVVETKETHESASFNFTTILTKGSYDLIVEAKNQTASRYRIIVHRPIQKCSKGVLWLTMPSGAGCGEIWYHKSRYVDFETPVGTREPAVQLAAAVH
jgi:hypothetical protein